MQVRTLVHSMQVFSMHTSHALLQVGDMESKFGCMVVVVGASGAGKDSIIDAAKVRYAANTRFGFVRRVITRASQPGSEEHDTLDEYTFKQWCDDGLFAVHWQANGLYYGLPLESLERVSKGTIMIANGSRAAVAQVIRVYPRVRIVHITARRDVLAKRLQNRKRETAAEIEQRLQRNAAMPAIPGEVFEIDNSGKLADAVDSFSAYLSQL